jgi:L(+)-tartrate dehydratase alpha subunit
MAGGGCTLPGKSMVLMPSAGYEGITKFVLDVMTEYGINACPPLLVGVGVATSVETAAILSKKALMRPIGSHNSNERAAQMEKLLEDGINSIGLGPQGLSGKKSVMGVHIEIRLDTHPLSEWQSTQAAGHTDADISSLIKI